MAAWLLPWDSHKSATHSKIPRPLLPRCQPCSSSAQALARNIQYRWLPPEQVPAAPDAKFFPGLPPTGTQPLAGPIARQVRAASCLRSSLGLYCVYVLIPAHPARLLLQRARLRLNSTSL